MPTTFANTINGNEILAKRSQCDYAGNDLQTTYATKSELPTATSDLTNDSEFITSSDVPVKDVQVGGESVVNAQGVAEISIPQTGVLDVEVDGSSVVNAQGVAEITLPTFTQVNADWDASSGVQEILHKPDLSIYAESSDLATVATTGSYDDLVNKPSIPSAQVNADWDATSGVSAILNKPNLATVATTGDYSDLQNLPSIPAAQVNSDWDATSGVSQILNKPSIPTATSDLTNDSDFITLSDVPAQVNADWNSSSGASEILNKPTIPSVDQSYSASSTNAQSGVAVAQAIASIPSSSYTAGNGIDITNNVVSAKVDGTTINTNASGELTVIGGGGGGSQVNSDWDATSGVAEILNKPDLVDIVAGPGIVVDNPDGNTLRVSTDENYEVDLYSNANGDGASTGISLSENPFNFEKIIIRFSASNGLVTKDETIPLSPHAPTRIMISSCTINDAGNRCYFVMGRYSISSTTLTRVNECQSIIEQQSIWTDFNQNMILIYKVIGVHRIANN